MTGLWWYEDTGSGQDGHWWGSDDPVVIDVDAILRDVPDCVLGVDPWGVPPEPFRLPADWVDSIHDEVWAE